MTYEGLIKIGISVHRTRENVHNNYINFEPIFKYLFVFFLDLT